MLGLQKNFSLKKAMLYHIKITCNVGISNIMAGVQTVRLKSFRNPTMETSAINKTNPNSSPLKIIRRNEVLLSGTLINL